MLIVHKVVAVAAAARAGRARGPFTAHWRARPGAAGAAAARARPQAASDSHGGPRIGAGSATSFSYFNSLTEDSESTGPVIPVAVEVRSSTVTVTQFSHESQAGPAATLEECRDRLFGSSSF